MSISKGQSSNFRDYVIRNINSNPEKLVEETRTFREKVLSEIEEVSTKVEKRCETHPDTEFRLHTHEAPEKNRKDLRLIADSIVLFDRNKGLDTSNILLEGTDLKRELSEKISSYTLSSKRNFEDHFRSGEATYNIRKDVIVFKHLPLDIKPASYPSILEPLVSYIFKQKYSINRLEYTLVHELTHSWLTKNSKLKSKGMEALIEKELDLAKVTVNDDLYVIDECFANLTEWVISGNKVEASQLTNYPEPEKIVWGTNILIERARKLEGKMNIIDWARKTEKRVFDDILAKGQVEHSPMASLLEAALYREDFRRMKKFKSVVSEELEPAFSDLKNSLQHLEESELEMQDQISYQRVKQIEEEVDWSNPGKMKSGLFERVIEEGVKKKYDLDKVSEEISYLMENEAGIIEEYAKHMLNLEDHVREEKLEKEIDLTCNELHKAASDINELA